MGFADAQPILQSHSIADDDAFISYNKAQDKPVAAALQAAVQRLGKPWYRRRALRIFRDDTSLSATPQLWPSIEQALARSRYLILLVSPQAAASRWVGKEVGYWLTNKSIDTFLPAVTDGEVDRDDKAGDFLWSAATPLPLALKGQFPTEPKWVDLPQDLFRVLSISRILGTRVRRRDDQIGEPISAHGRFVAEVCRYSRRTVSRSL